MAGGKTYGMAFAEGVDVEEGERPGRFVDPEAGDLAWCGQRRTVSEQAQVGAGANCWRRAFGLID